VTVVIPKVFAIFSCIIFSPAVRDATYRAVAAIEIGLLYLMGPLAFIFSDKSRANLTILSGTSSFPE
jgi:hypothetical protein